MVPHLPEGWTLPSIVTLVLQFGNIGPLIFSLLVYTFPKTKFEVPVSIAIVAVLTVIPALYAFTWAETSSVFGKEHSVALLTLTFVQATFAATSSMSYLAIMSKFHYRYMGSVFVGMSFSGLLPALFATAQGSENIKCVANTTANNTTFFDGELANATSAPIRILEDPVFSVEAFFFILSGLGLCSMCALLCLLYHPYCKTEHVAYEHVALSERSSGASTTKLKPGDAEYNSSDCNIDTTIKQEDTTIIIALPTYEFWFLLSMQVWINMLLPSYLLAIQIYSSLPFGIFFFHAVTRTENVVDAIACLLSGLVAAKTTRTIACITLLGTLFTSYIVVVAAMSPSPVLIHETFGGVVVIAAWVMCTLCMVFSKVSIAVLMRSQGRTSLLWTGGSTQFGAFLGAVLAYITINHLDLFKSGPWCK